MGSGFTLDIPYDQIMLLVMALFMFIGAVRGWHREFFTTCVLLVLLVFLINPLLAAPVAEYLAKLVRLILALVQGRGSLDPDQLLEHYETIEVPFGAGNPYLFLVIFLVGFVLVSYGTRTNTGNLSALSRILGGVLGLLNGYLVISLIRDYVLKHFQREAPELAAAGPPSQFSVAVSDLPPSGLLGEGGRQGMLLLLVVVAVLLFGKAADRRATRRE